MRGSCSSSTTGEPFGVVPSAYLIAYAFSNYALVEQLPALIEMLEKRIPGADVTAQQLRTGHGGRVRKSS